MCVRLTYPLENPPQRRFNFWAAWYALLRKTDVIYTRSSSAALCAANLGMHVVLERHAPAEVEGDAFRQLMVHRNFVGLVTIAPVLKDSYLALGMPDEKVLVADDGVDVHAFLEASGDAIRRQYVSEGQLLVIYSGHLYENRGIELILDLADLFSDVQFLIVGGWDKDIVRYQQDLVNRNLTNLKFTGFVNNSQVPNYLKAADVLLMPHSRNETNIKWTSPLKMFEYMASGRPILGSDFATFRRVLKHGESAWLCEADSLDSFQKGLALLLSSKDLREKIGRRAQSIAMNYSWDERARKICDYFNLEQKNIKSTRCSIIYQAIDYVCRKVGKSS